jgi:ABC-type transport system substrate-binding protein
LLLGYWSEIGVDVEVQVVPQSDLITLGLFGDPAFQVALWRNYAGSYVSDQYFWWHSVNAAPVGQLALNFGRIRDPEIDASLEAARGALTAEEGRTAAETINRRFAEECYQIPLSWTKWGIITALDVQGYGDFRVPGTDLGLRQAAGQFWTHSFWRSSEG